MSEQLGLREVVAMGVGGLIGGGIFAVLGVAAEIAGNAAFLAYLIAGGVAMALDTRIRGSQPTSTKREVRSPSSNTTPATKTSQGWSDGR